MAAIVLRIALSTAVALSVSVAACSSQPSRISLPADGACALGKSANAVPAPLLPGKLIETANASLEVWSGGQRSTIACAPGGGAYIEYPAWSPDGKRVAYVLATTPTAQGQDWGNDVYDANADGSGARMALKHDAPGALIDALAWMPDGQALLVGYNRAVFDAQGRYQSFILQIQRLSLADGSQTTLLNNASQASISWDGTRIVYVGFPTPDLRASSLALVNLDGSDAHEILTGQQGFQAFFAPHLSPDGKRVVFAAVGGPIAPAIVPQGALPRQPTLSGGVLPGLATRLRPLGVSADGSPYEVWVANLDGSDLHPVANLREDLPYPLWSSDGKSVLFLGAAALYLAAAEGSDVKRIDKGVAHGEIAWYQRYITAVP